MNALLAISVDVKGISKKTPIVRKTKNKYLPPTNNSTNIKKSDSIITKRMEKVPNFRIKSKSNFHQNSIN